jgi:ABC-type antimicrobial peptide transport system permease subunit
LVLGGIGGIALAVAAIGVVNTMIMAILERTREIGVMRAVGAKRGTVSRLFTIEASLLGFWGGVLGVAVGYGLASLANVFINKQLASNGLQARNIITLPPWLIITVIIITTVIGMLAGLYPARRAAKLDPVEALHYE